MSVQGSSIASLELLLFDKQIIRAFEDRVDCDLFCGSLMEFTKSRYHFDNGLAEKRNSKRKGRMVVNFCILFQIVTINFSSPF